MDEWILEQCMRRDVVELRSEPASWIGKLGLDEERATYLTIIYTTRWIIM